MSTPIETMLALNNAELELDTVQSWIHRARHYAGANQEAQLVLDRQQADVDTKRLKIQTMRLAISMYN